MKHEKRKLHNRNRSSFFLPIVTFLIIGIFSMLAGFYEPAWIYSWKDMRPEVRDSVKLLAQYNSITSGVVSYDGHTPQQWYRRHWIMRHASEKELIRLLDYPSGIVKTVAYEGLIKKPGSNKFALLCMAIKDTTAIFNYQSGCEGSLMLAGEYLASFIVPELEDYPPPLVKKFQHNLTVKEIEYLKMIYHEQMIKKDEFIRHYYELKNLSINLVLLDQEICSKQSIHRYA